MDTTPDVAGPRWPLIIALSLIALLRPGVRITATQLDVDLHALVPVAMTVVITLVWVVAVGFTETARPVLTLVTVGLVYVVASLVVSGFVAPILDGELAGPLAEPIAIAPFILINVAWGAISGVLAWGIQRLRQSRRGRSVCAPPNVPVD